MDNLFWLTFGMLIVTYLGRIAGYWFIRYTEPSEKMQDFFRSVPSTIFVAMIAPQLTSAGVIGCLAAILTFLIAIKSGNMLISLSVGMITYISLQNFI